jgi:hypothetical protein
MNNPAKIEKDRTEMKGRKERPVFKRTLDKIGIDKALYAID